MKYLKSLLALSLIAIPTLASANTKYIHKWAVDGSAGWRSDINVSNVCHNESVNVVVQFWTSDGSILANKRISSVHTTDADGKVSFTLLPHESTGVSFDYTYFNTFTYGNGEITTSYTNPDALCLVGGYQYHTTVGSNNPYGHALSYHFNNGDKF